jgi:hypothetical protein
MLFRRLLFAWILRRFADRGRRRRSTRYRYGYGYPRRGRNVGFFGPFPTYSTRTRGGSRVTVTGCCLPIPLGLATALALGVRALLRR